MKIGTCLKIDYREAQVLGKARYTNNREHGVSVSKAEGVPHVESDIEGVAGELAFASMVGASTEEVMRIGVTEAATDRGDVFFNNQWIDVKTTVYHEGHLLVGAAKLALSIDGYALMTGKRGTYTFRGYISSAEIRDQAASIPLRDGVYWIPQHKLRELPSG